MHQSCATMDLYFRCETLRDMDTFSKSDPYLVLYYSPADGAMPAAPVPGRRSHRGVEAGRTETLMNDLNPVFKKAIRVPFFFEQKQPFHLVVFDDDGHANDEENDMCGEAPFLLSQVVGSRNHTRTIDLHPKGKVHITAVEVSQNPDDIVELTFQGKDMKKMDFFGLSDPYFHLFHVLPNGTKNLLYKSEYISSTLNPLWRACPKFTLSKLAGADLNKRTLEFECWDADTFSDDYMGCFQVSVQELIDANKNNTCFTLRKPKKSHNKRYGDIYVSRCHITHFPTFAEFLRAGQEINLAVSVDFTGSNGDPRDPRSLHYMNPHSPNQYVRAIMGVGEILMEYDTDKMVPAFGFGARLPGGTISHFFHLNMTENPYVHGVQGVLDSYGQALSSVRLAGPTNFAPTIRAIAAGAQETKDVYTVLLIITDGEITDMDDTIDAVVACDALPISIVIVGVGNDCDFEMMDQLDADEVALKSRRNVICRRDLVQFVPFRQFSRSPPGALAAEVLREIPAQFTRWAQLAGVRPPQTAPAPVAPSQPVAKLPPRV